MKDFRKVQNYSICKSISEVQMCSIARASLIAFSRWRSLRDSRWLLVERLWNSTIVIAASCRVENRSLLSSRFPFLILILDTEPNPIVFFSNTKSATLVIPLLLKRNGHHFQCLGDRTSSDGWSFPPFYWLNIILTLTFAVERHLAAKLLFLTF